MTHEELQPAFNEAVLREMFRIMRCEVLDVFKVENPCILSCKVKWGWKEPFYVAFYQTEEEFLVYEETEPLTEETEPRWVDCHRNLPEAIVGLVGSWNYW